MELEQLKDIWETTSEKETAKNRIDDRAVRAMISKKSKTTVSNIKRTMWFKLWMAGLSSIASIILSVYHLASTAENPLFLENLLTKSEVGFIFMVMGIVMVFISIYNFINYKRVDEFEKSNEPLKHTLIRIIEIIDTKIKLTIYSDLAFTPLIAGFIAYIALFKRQGFVLDIRALYLVLIVLAVAAFSYFINERIMKRKFGNDMERLKDYLYELESSEK